MKKSFSKNLTTLLWGAVICIVFTSCENFMKGDIIRKEIEEAIAYNNAQECTVVFRADSGVGEFLGSVERTFHVGYETEIQFELNKDDYVFKGLEALNSDRTESREDYVTFEKISEDQKKGLYKYKVTLIKEAKDITIQPICITLPKVTQIEPITLNTSCEQDSRVIFTFNKPVNPESFGDFSCISFFADDNLAEYFGTPYFDNTFTKLYIPTVTDKHILAPDGNKKNQIVYVDYDFTKVLDKDGLNLSASGTHDYKINQTFGNQKIIKIYIQEKTAQGEFFSSAERDCTVGFTIDVQYTLNKTNYKFIDFEAVDKTNNSTRYTCFSVEDKDYNNERGIYKAKIRITEEQENILIRPKCFAYPAVQSISSVSLTGVNQVHIPIVITFNTAMEDSVVSKVNLFLNDKDMGEYFEKPVLSDDKSILTITPKGIKLKEYMNKEAMSFVYITVSFADDVSITKEGEILPLKQDSNTNFRITYEPNFEQIPPALTGKFPFIVSRNNISLNDFSNMTEQEYNSFEKFYLEDFDVSTVEFDMWEENYGSSLDREHILQNRNNGIIYIYGKYYDKDSGVNSIVVTDQRTHEPDNCEEVDEELFEHTYIKDSNDNNVQFYSDRAGNTVFWLKHTLQSNDGAVLVTVTVKDSVGNKSETKSFTVIKRTELDLWNVNLYNMPKAYYNEDGNPVSPVELDVYQANKNNIKIFKFTDYDYYNDNEYIIDPAEFYYGDLIEFVYGNITLEGEDIQFFCTYTDKNGNERKDVPFSNYDPVTNSWNLDLDVNEVAGLEVLITAKNSIGSTGETDFAFPTKIVPYSIEDKGTYKSVRYNSETYGFWYMQLIKNDLNDNFISSTIEKKQYSLNIYPDYHYKIFPYNGGLCGDLQVVNTQRPDGLPKPKIEKVEISRCTDESVTDFEKKLDLNVKIDKNSWNTFDSIYFYCHKKGSSIDFVYDFAHYIEKNSLNEIYTITAESIYKNDLEITAYGTIGGFTSDPTNYEIPKCTDGSYDYVPPKFNLTQNDYYTGTITLSDFGGGLDYAKINIGKWEFESTNQFEDFGNEDVYTIEIPVSAINDHCYQINDNGSRTIYVDYTLRDKGGNVSNSVGEYYTFLNANFPKFTKFEKTDETVTIQGTDYHTWNFSTEKVKYLASSTGPGHYKLSITRYYLSRPDSQWGLWLSEFSRDVEIDDTEASQGLYGYSLNSIPVYNDRFMRLDCIYDKTNSKRYMDRVYFYTGEPGSSDNHYLLPSNTPKTSILISSDTPVYVHTIVTTKPYEECKDWTVDEWENYHRVIGDKYLEFRESDPENPGQFIISGPSVKSYSIPVDEINSGECYTVVVYFADNVAINSSVMVK